MYITISELGQPLPLLLFSIVKLYVHVYVWVCACVRMCACMCVRMCVCTYECAFLCISACVMFLCMQSQTLHHVHLSNTPAYIILEGNVYSRKYGKCECINTISMSALVHYAHVVKLNSTHTHIRTYTHTRARAHAHTHTHTTSTYNNKLCTGCINYKVNI